MHERTGRMHVAVGTGIGFRQVGKGRRSLITGSSLVNTGSRHKRVQELVSRPLRPGQACGSRAEAGGYAGSMHMGGGMVDRWYQEVDQRQEALQFSACPPSWRGLVQTVTNLKIEK